jgi:hypothetical protein
MSIVNKDGAKHVKDGGDILELFGTKAKVDITPAEEALAAGHAERIGTALQHIGRGRDVLQVLIAEAARGRRPSQQPLIQDHDQVTPAGANAPSRGPAAEQAAGGPPMKSLKVEGDIVIDGYNASAFFEAVAANLVNLKASILGAARDGFVSKKEFPILFAKARESVAAGVAADRGVVLRSEVQEVIVAPMLEFARKLISQRLMVTKNSNGQKGGDLRGA